MTEAFVPAYSMMSDPQSSMAKDPLLLRSLKAHVVLNYIVYGSVAATDTQALVAPNLRKLLIGDHTSRELVRQGWFTFLVREDAKGQTFIRPTAQKLEDTGSATELDQAVKMLEAARHSIRWQFAPVAKRYTSGSTELFKNGVFTTARLNRFIVDFIEETLSKAPSLENVGPTLNRADFHFKAPAYLRARGVRLQPKTVQALKLAADAWYYDGVSSATNAVPLLDSPTLAAARLRHHGVQNWRKVKEQHVRESHPLSALDMRFLAEGLADLETDEVVRLANHSAAIRLRKLVRDVPTPESMDAVEDCLVELFAAIDSAILLNQPSWRVNRGRDNGRKLRLWSTYTAAGASMGWGGEWAVGMAVDHVLPNLPPGSGIATGALAALGVGFAIEVAVDRLKRRTGHDIMEAREQSAQLLQLERRLRAEGKDQRVAFLGATAKPEDPVTRIVR